MGVGVFFEARNLTDRQYVSSVVVDTDDGAPFDPTGAPGPVLSGPLAQRHAGGMGVLFVRQLTDSMEYRRVEGRNRITLRRRLGSA